MGGMSNLLLATDFVPGLLNVLSMIMTIAGAALVVYAVYLFFMMMLASSEEKRRKVKRRIFMALSSLFIIIALIATLSVLKINIKPIQQDQTPGGASGSIWDGAEIASSSISPLSIARTSGPQFSGSTVISTSCVKLKVSGAKVTKIQDFAINGGGLGQPKVYQGGSSLGWNVSTNGSGLTVKFITSGPPSGTLSLKADSGNQAGTSQDRFINFSITVVGQDAKGNVSSQNLSGTMRVKAGNSSVIITL